MSFDGLPPFKRDELRALEYGLANDELGRSALLITLAGVNDPFSKQVIRSRVYHHEIQRAFHGGFVSPRLTHGDLVLGLDIERERWLRCPSQYLNEHVLTSAASGSGKTTRSWFTVGQLAQLEIGLWLFDLRKREFARLKPYMQRIGVELLVVPARELKLNPLQVPDGCDPRDYASNVAGMLVRVHSLPPGATRLLHMSVLALYHEFGVLTKGKSGLYPTHFDLRESIARNKRANPQSREATIAAMDPVLMSIGSVLNHRLAWKTSDLARLKIVFELGGVSEMDQDLILNTILLGEFTRRISQGISNPEMDLYVNCDEAARLVG